ncbi:MAG: glycosyltransferase family 2 protein [Candidatus Korarchaeota archaeon]|nr:glycosyltransferase family 2 protein [Candidatus Korarchaeota archaeon]
MGAAATLLTIALGAIHAWLAVRALLGMSRIPRLNPARVRGGPRVSVIVPARNERGRVGRCVRSLLSQDYGDLEVIVVDDSSTDGTPDEALEAAAGDPRFRLVRTPKPPEGWLGKTWACWIGFSESSGEVLLFVDADVEVAEWAVSGIVSALEGADAATASPTYSCRGLACAAELALATTIRIFFPQWRVGSPDERSWGFGGFFAVWRRAYVGVGGHEAVRSSPVEDRDLARLLASRGFRVNMLRGVGAVRSTWATSAREALDAVARISSRDAPLNPMNAAGVAAGLAALYAWPPLALLMTLLGLVPVKAALLASTAEIAHALTPIIFREVRADPVSVVLFPAGGLVVALGLWRAHLFRRGRACVRWRGREICPASSGPSLPQPLQ